MYYENVHNNNYFIFLFKFTTNKFFVAIESEIIFLIYFLGSLLLVHTNTVDFYMLALCLKT
jgi:hypothetical protein